MKKYHILFLSVAVLIVVISSVMSEPESTIRAESGFCGVQITATTVSGYDLKVFRAYSDNEPWQLVKSYPVMSSYGEVVIMDNPDPHVRYLARRQWRGNGSIFYSTTSFINPTGKQCIFLPVLKHK